MDPPQRHKPHTLFNPWQAATSFHCSAVGMIISTLEFPARLGDMRCSLHHSFEGCARCLSEQCCDQAAGSEQPFFDRRVSSSVFICLLSFVEIMTGTTAKAQLVDLLLDPLRGCTGLYSYRQQLVRRVMKMPTLEVRDRLDYLRQINFPGA